MGTADQAKHKVEELSGKAKEAAGRATEDDDLEREGQLDQAKASLKKAGEEIKDAFN